MAGEQEGREEEVTRGAEVGATEKCRAVGGGGPGAEAELCQEERLSRPGASLPLLAWVSPSAPLRSCLAQIPTWLWEALSGDNHTQQ